MNLKDNYYDYKGTLIGKNSFGVIPRISKVYLEKDIKESVLEFLDTLNKIDGEMNLPNELFDKYLDIFGDFEK